ncbi:DedA family protein [Brachybacterium halotolerans subsp. kimchii]|uniref:DedA family protein n=1 Tax=Brachybacterium halotolerans TaxID=2795215 RepID=UPI001E4DD3C6|nr:DedA family protein [Brachybacterium halotolerans]UEJ83472.1 DedA family protein [Brachybacterium halotolerans subsp. kimchii]
MGVGTFQAWMSGLQDWIVAAGDTWWVHLVVFALCAIDAFFPTVPSESVIVALSSLWASSSVPPIWLTVLAAWGGAFLGDNIAYLIGRTVGWQRFGFLHRGRGLKAVQAAERGLDRRALLFLMTARYIPFGRTAVNLTAGAVRYPWRRFWHRSLAATFVWAVYSCGIGAVAGSWFEDNHLLAITVAVVIAVVVALVVERLVSLMNHLLDSRHERAAQQAEQEAAQREDVGSDDQSDGAEVDAQSGDGPSAAPRETTDGVGARASSVGEHESSDEDRSAENPGAESDADTYPRRTASPA